MPFEHSHRDWSSKKPEAGKERAKQERSELYQPIPLELPSVAGWKEISLEENGEPLVPIGSFAGNTYDRLFSSSIYYGERDDSPYERGSLGGSLVAMFARQEVADQLLRAETDLPQGMHLILLDTYRTLEVQQALYDQYYGALKAQNPGWSAEALSAETQKFVSLPSTNPERPSPHNTGGAVDLAIYRLPPAVDQRVTQINERIEEIGQNEANWEEVYRLEMERIGLIAQNAELLNFGTRFDYGGQEAALNHFERLAEERNLEPYEEEARMNRRLLYNVMMRVGFKPYADEWWHFNSEKTQMGAKTAGKEKAEYGAARLLMTNQQYDKMRKDHLRGTEWATQVIGFDKLGRQIATLGIVAETARQIGDMRRTSLPGAAIIEPPDQKAS